MVLRLWVVLLLREWLGCVFGAWWFWIKVFDLRGSGWGCFGVACFGVALVAWHCVSRFLGLRVGFALGEGLL